MLKRSVILILAAIVLFGAGGLQAGPADNSALTRLIEGNRRVVEGKQSKKEMNDQTRKILSKGRHPFAAVLSCSDLRVPPEYIFDQGFGDLYVVRTAGNVVDPIAIGSIEYGIERLHVPLLVILGHQNCGAIAAAYEATVHPKKDRGGHTRDSFGRIVNKIIPAVVKAKSAAKTKRAVLDEAVRENARNVKKELLAKSASIRKLVAERKLRIAIGEYNMESGEVKFLE